MYGLKIILTPYVLYRLARWSATNRRALRTRSVSFSFWATMLINIYTIVNLLMKVRVVFYILDKIHCFHVPLYNLTFSCKLPTHILPLCKPIFKIIFVCKMLVEHYWKYNFVNFLLLVVTIMLFDDDVPSVGDGRLSAGPPECAYITSLGIVGERPTHRSFVWPHAFVFYKTN